MVFLYTYRLGNLWSQVLVAPPKIQNPVVVCHPLQSVWSALIAAIERAGVVCV